MSNLKYIYIGEYYEDIKSKADSLSRVLWSDHQDILLSEETKVQEKCIVPSGLRLEASIWKNGLASPKETSRSAQKSVIPEAGYWFLTALC